MESVKTIIIIIDFGAKKKFKLVSFTLNKKTDVNFDPQTTPEMTLSK